MAASFNVRANVQWKREPENTEIGLRRSVFGFWRRRQMQSINKGKFMSPNVAAALETESDSE